MTASTTTKTTTTQERPSGRFAFFVAVVIVFVLPHIPFASLVARPLVWLSTLAHEGGHGVASLVVGGGFERLQIFFDASGVMTPARGVDAAWKQALVSLGGLTGPAVVAAVFCVAGVSGRVARGVLVVCAAACAVAAVTVAAGFAVVVAGGFAVVFAALAVVCGGARARVAVLVVAVELAGAVFSRSDYLFTAVADTGAGRMPSDVAHIAQVLGGHYLVWGTAIAAVSIALLGAGAAVFFAGDALVSRWHVYRAKKKAR